LPFAGNIDVEEGDITELHGQRRYGPNRTLLLEPEQLDQQLQIIDVKRPFDVLRVRGRHLANRNFKARDRSSQELIHVEFLFRQAKRQPLHE
jgi:hypothetical protein